MDYESWIKNDLIPDLVKDGKFETTWTNSDTSKLISVDVNRLSTADAFMLTNCFKIQVTLSDASGEQLQNYGLVVKTSPNWPEDILKDATFNILFKNEITAYTDMFPNLQWTGYLPKYYYSHIKGKNEAVIALSDFTMVGYRMSKAKGKLSLEHIYESVILLGRFHGFAYALKHTDRQKFDSIKIKFEEARYIEGKPYEEPWNTIVKHSIVRAFKTTREHKNKEYSQITDEFLDTLQNLLADPQEYQRIMFQPIEPYATLCHGDYLRNNIAFKYSDEECNTPEKAIMFDFQTIRYASPMADLTTFMANSTGVDVRTKHFEYIFRTYHTELIKTYLEKTHNQQEDLPEFLSYNSMLMEYGRYMPFGNSIAYGFVASCLDPKTVNFAELATMSIEEILRVEEERGGETVNRELRALTYDIYRFYQKYNLKI